MAPCARWFPGFAGPTLLALPAVVLAAACVGPAAALKPSAPATPTGDDACCIAGAGDAADGRINAIVTVARPDVRALLAAALTADPPEPAFDAAAEARALAAFDAALGKAEAEAGAKSRDWERGQAVFQVLHRDVLKSNPAAPFDGYAADESRIGEALRAGRYNCLSSAYLFALLAEGAGLRDVRVVFTRSHAFAEFSAEGTTVEVETTDALMGYARIHDAAFFSEATRFAAERRLSPPTPEDYARRVRVDLRRATARLFLNVVEWSTVPVEAGIKRAERAARLDPDFAPGFIDWAFMLARAGNAAAADAALRPALAARLARALPLFDAAARRSDDARLRANTAVLFNLWAFAGQDAVSVEETERRFERAAAVDPANRVYRENRLGFLAGRATERIGAGDAVGARPLVDRCRGLDPEYAPCRKIAAHLRFLEGERAFERQDFRAAAAAYLCAAELAVDDPAGGANVRASFLNWAGERRRAGDWLGADRAYALCEASAWTGDDCRSARADLRSKVRLPTEPPPPAPTCANPP